MLFILNNFGAQETFLLNVENSLRLDASSSLTIFSGFLCSQCYMIFFYELNVNFTKNDLKKIELMLH